MGVFRPLRLPGFLLSVVCLLGAAGACSYHSEYIAPQDGRPRVVFEGSNPHVELAGAALTEECGMAIKQLSGHNSFGTGQGLVEFPDREAPRYIGGGPLIVTGGYWVPRYYGPSIYVGSPGLVPRFLRPPIFFSPSMMIARAAVPRISVWRPGMPVRIGGGGGGGSIGRSGGGGSGDLGKGALLLAIVALTIIPAIDIGLAAGRPESASTSSTSTDVVNVYNDLMRSPGSPCSMYEAVASPVDSAPPALPMPGAVP